jgi:SAM-dependent methyltransferase
VTINPAKHAAVEAQVKTCYSTWGESYYGDYYGPDAPYPPVHLDLVRRLVDGVEATRLLDAGCGPASMLRHLTAPGRAVYGFDLTPEMTSEARRVMTELGVAPDHLWNGSVLDPAHYVPPGETHAAFDCVVRCGVLPHVPDGSDPAVIANIRDALRPGGTAIVEARNELFSLFTLNRYSHQFFRDRLLSVAQLQRDAGAERAGLDQALAQMESIFRTDLPPIRRGKADEPGYDEVLSRSHNPLSLRQQFETLGFAETRLMFYHFHCLPPMLAAHVPQLFRAGSLAMEANPGDWRGLFMASAFFVVAKRA